MQPRLVELIHRRSRDNHEERNRSRRRLVGVFKLWQAMEVLEPYFNKKDCRGATCLICYCVAYSLMPCIACSCLFMLLS